ncbi:DedD protein [Nitrosomonas sp. PY1]|uniref:SPOR domain-containing protein n=1 Tax=Nitrosomonas sp. PY1 TaxID=1803906 RepID=UPI001FC8E56F|nr:SPOR domain-containing protein [Nitrosomonas sp. PY1]GKS69850.1 DedD protein [Nitrosomonas sp. PY1]
MNKNISEEELLLRKRARRRLVGAIVLVIVSIIVLPAIFDEPKTGNEQQEVVINLHDADRGNNTAPVHLPKQSIPSNDLIQEANQLPDSMKENVPFVDDFEAIQDEQKRLPIPGIKPKIDAKRVTVVMEPKSPAVSTTHLPNSSNNTANATADVIGTTEIPKGGVVIQLGAFSDQSKAKQQLENLVMSGFRAYTEIIKTSSGEVTRVRIGPLASRSVAENELKKLNKLGFDGVITSK